MSDPEKSTSDYATEEAMESIRKLIIKRYLPGKNEALALGIALEYAHLKRDLYIQENNLSKKAEWSKAIEQAREDSFGRLITLIKSDAQYLLDSHEREFFEKKEREGFALNNLAKSLPKHYS